MTEVQEILDRIERLPPADRLMLGEHLAKQAEAEWQAEARLARRIAKEKGVDQAMIDDAVARVRYPS